MSTDLRALVAEILDHLDDAGLDVDGELRAAWAERAGITPAFVTAGTDHIALQLLHPDYPDGPRWQRVADVTAREGA